MKDVTLKGEKDRDHTVAEVKHVGPTLSLVYCCTLIPAAVD